MQPLWGNTSKSYTFAIWSALQARIWNVNIERTIGSGSMVFHRVLCYSSNYMLISHSHHQDKKNSYKRILYIPNCFTTTIACYSYLIHLWKKPSILQHIVRINWCYKNVDSTCIVQVQMNVNIRSHKSTITDKSDICPSIINGIKTSCWKHRHNNSVTNESQH